LIYYNIYSLENLPNEEWKPIEGFERYLVSNYGRVKSLIGKEKILKQFTTETGYLIVKLCKDNKPYNRRIHRLVARAFIDVDDDNKEVHHINRNKKDNTVNNLMWIAKEEHYKIHRGGNEGIN